MISERKRAANRRNWALRRGLTDDGRRRLREAALRNRPWTHATGPRTPAGKARSSDNATKSGEFTADRRAEAQQTRAIIAAGSAGLTYVQLLCRCFRTSSRLALLAATLPDESPRSLRRLARADDRLDDIATLAIQAMRRFRALACSSDALLFNTGTRGVSSGASVRLNESGGTARGAETHEPQVRAEENDGSVREP